MSETLNQTFEQRWAAAEKIANETMPAAATGSEEEPQEGAQREEDEAAPAAAQVRPAPKVEPGAPTVAERIAMRKRTREAKATLATERAAAQAWLDEQRASIATEAQRAKAVSAAIESGDWDGLAKAVGKESWNDLNAEVLAHYQDPSRREVQRLRAEVDADRKRSADERTAWAARQAEEAQQATAAQTARAQQQYRDTVIVVELKGSGDAILELASRDTEFVDAVFAAQREAWDPDAGDTITVAEAAQSVLASLRRNPISRLRRDLLAQIISDQEGGDASDRDASPESPTRLPPARGRAPRERVTAPMSITQSAARGPSEAVSQLNDRQWRRLAIEKMEAAHKR